MTLRAVPEPPAPDFAPIRVVEVRLEDPPAPIAGGTSPAGARYGSALVVVRLHDDPLGMFVCDLPPEGLDAEAVRARVDAALGGAIAAHRAADGDGEPPRCLVARDAFRADAPALTVLVPSRDRPERLARCLDSILACAYPADRFEIVVVDNAPATDATRALVAGYDRVRYVREDAPGSASARNAGLRTITTELVAMTDDDVLVDAHWLTEVARAFAAHPAAAAMSGLLVPLALDTPPQLWFEQYGGFSRGFERRVFDLAEHRVDDPLYPWTAGVFGTGNNFAFRTEALRAMGGFDPALGNGTPALGGVDSEMLLRTILEGHQIVYEPRAIVHHAHRPDYQALRRQVHAYGTGLVAYYLKTLHDDPRRIGDFVRRLPAGARFMLSAESHINRHKLDDYPGELEWLERRGMLYGPLAYARSRRRYGRHVVPLERAA